MGIQTSFENTFSSFWYISRSKAAKSYEGSIFNLLRNLHTILHSICTSLQLSPQCRKVPTSPHRCWIFSYTQTHTHTDTHTHNPNGCNGVAHGGFDLYFFDDSWCWTSFHILTSYLYILLGEMPSLPSHWFSAIWLWLPLCFFSICVCAYGKNTAWYCPTCNWYSVPFFHRHISCFILKRLYFIDFKFMDHFFSSVLNLLVPVSESCISNIVFFHIFFISRCCMVFFSTIYFSHYAHVAF